jgi:hypothetical protein
MTTNMEADSGTMVVLARGLNAEGVFGLSGDSIANTEAALQYYISSLSCADSKARIGRIIFSGAWAEGTLSPRDGVSEAGGMKAYFINRLQEEAIDLPDGLLDTETQSHKTFDSVNNVATRFVESTGRMVGAEHPLFIVAGVAGLHAVRASVIMKRRLGVESDAIRIIKAPGRPKSTTIMWEVAGIALTKLALTGAQPKSAEAIERAGKRYGLVVSPLRSLGRFKDGLKRGGLALQSK